jgi:pimeloyl-ACP methyl ester carboxylesterase
MSGAALGRVEIEIDGEGPPIVFLHGLGATSSSFQPLLPALRGFRCIRPDFPGAGRSPRPYVPVTIDFLCGTALDVVKSVAGAPAHIVAHSLGTLVAQHLAVSASEWVASLTLFGPIDEPGDAARERMRDRAALARRSGMIAIADPVAAAGLSSSTRADNPAAEAFVRESHLRQDPEGFAESCEALALAKGADLRLLSCPTLVVTGEDDPIAPSGVAQGLADKIKGAKLRTLPRCGHWTPIEHPKECARLASEHIRAHA